MKCKNEGNYEEKKKNWSMKGHWPRQQNENDECGGNEMK